MSRSPRRGDVDWGDIVSRPVWLIGAILLSTVPTFTQQARNPQDEFFLRQAKRIDPGAAPTGPAPRTPDNKPDLNGLWVGGGPVRNIAEGLGPGESVPLLPAARKLKESRVAKDDPVANCLPTGLPRITTQPWRILQTPSRFVFLYESNTPNYRQIFMDGRTHPSAQALNPTWFGHSIGRWDGDTLVIDTVGFTDRLWFDFVGHPNTERLHVVERYTRRDLGILENAITIDDPGAYLRPFTVIFRAFLVPGAELMEFVCNENNMIPQRLRGTAAEAEDRVVPGATR